LRSFAQASFALNNPIKHKEKLLFEDSEWFGGSKDWVLRTNIIPTIMSFANHYHQAIVLNNVGVALLKRRALSLAMETFRGALKEMKMLIRPSLCPNENATTTFPRKFQKAFNALASYDQARQVETSEMTFGTNAGFHLPSVLNLIMDAGCFSSTLTPIKIELADFEYMEERDADLDSAIMLYNMSLVHRLVAARQDCPQKFMSTNKSALRLLRMSFALVSKTPVPEGLTFEEEQDVVRNRVHASSIFLYYQTRTLLDLGLIDEAEHCLRHLSILGSELAEMMDIGFTIDSSCPPTAAAA
jgi:hypothetical protein